MSAACCDPGTGDADVHHDDTHHDDEHDHGDEHAAPPWWRDRQLLPPLASGLLLAAGYLAGGAAGTVLHVLSLLAGAWTFVPRALRSLVLRRRLGVGLLMTIAAIGAVALGHVAEAAALAFLFSIAEALEDRAMDRARAGLRSLLSLVPETAVVSRLSGEVEVPARDLRELDLLVVRAGERVATDGVVTSGRSSLDTSAITGESIPVEVGPGDAVAAGSINGSGALQIEATADGRDNSLTTLVRLVEQAQARKGERARLADRIARPLVPAILVLAALVALVGSLAGDPGTWIGRALVVLVAASPCALAISVPVTVISAIGAASRFGVVVKSGAAFEQLGAVRRVALDKTGTLTLNRPAVTAVVPAPGVPDGELLATAAALESRSTHPLATAVVRAAGTVPAADDVEEHPGRGLTGAVGGVPVRVGSPRWIDPGDLAGDAARLESAGMTVVVVERDEKVAGLVGVRDELRAEAAEAVAQLRAQRIDVMILTGDNARTAAALAGDAGIANVRAELRPADKEAAVRASAATGVTAMIGDGINDAPALAAADVGIAMGATGSDAAIESADVAFTGHDLRLLPRALAHARRGRRIMTANIALSLLIIVVLVPLAITGALGLAAVVLVHELAEVVVILNGVRAARSGPGSTSAAPSAAPAVRGRPWRPAPPVSG